MQVTLRFKGNGDHVNQHIARMLGKVGRDFAKGTVRDGYTISTGGVDLSVSITQDGFPPPNASKVLCLFLLKELENESNGGDSPTTLGSANDSLIQMNDQVVADTIGDNFADGVCYDDMRVELNGYVEKYGYGYRVDQINLEV